MPYILLLSALLAFLSGMATATQGPTNSLLARAGGSVTIAALISFAIGTAALVGIALVTRPQFDAPALRTVPWYGWIGGFYGVLFVMTMAFATPRIGAATAITMAIAGQLVAALVIDRFGLFGLFGVPRMTIGIGRMAGVALVLVGVWLVRRP